jgi:hypothetical protein
MILINLKRNEEDLPNYAIDLYLWFSAVDSQSSDYQLYIL